VKLHVLNQDFKQFGNFNQIITFSFQGIIVTIIELIVYTIKAWLIENFISSSLMSIKVEVNGEKDIVLLLELLKSLQS